MSPLDPRHGTYTGYRAHGRAGTKACDPCCKARAAYERERYQHAPWSACTNCGTQCRAKLGLCINCRDLPETLRESDLLLDGRWVRNGLTLRWVAAA